jgi:anti-anti-sigma regulatory factor
VSDSQALNKKHRLYAEQVRQLYKQAPVGLMSIPIVSLIMVILLWTVVPHWILITWFSVVLLVAAPRYLLVVKFSGSLQASARADRWEAYFAIGAALSGIVWGAASLFLFPVNSVAHQCLIALMLGGMVAGAAGTYSVIMKTFLAYSLPALIPLAIRFFLFADRFSIGVGSVILVYQFLMIATAKRVNTAIVSSLEMRFENEDLVERLMTEVKHADELNTKYAAEIAQRKQAEEERDRLQQEAIEAHRQALRALSTPIIPVMEHIIVMPLIGTIDSIRARDIMRTLLAGIQQQRARVVILDITGVPIVDSGVASHLSKTIQAARLKGTRVIITGISDAVAEIIVGLGIDWSGIEILSDLQTGLVVALGSLGIKLTSLRSY